MEKINEKLNRMLRDLDKSGLKTFNQDGLFKLIECLKIAVDALNSYSRQEVLMKPDSWNWFKHGGGPEIENYSEVSHFADNALEQIAEKLGIK